MIVFTYEINMIEFHFIVQLDCFGKFCINGGSLDLKTCTCNCIQGVQSYDPEHCERKFLFISSIG
jgi:hypothetical protein